MPMPPLILNKTTIFCSHTIKTGWNSCSCLRTIIWRQLHKYVLFVWMGFNASFNNISVISRRSVLLVEEAGVTGENHRPWAGNWQTLSRAMRVKCNPFLYGTNPGANSCRIGDRIQWSVQVSLNQLPRPLGQSYR